MSNNGSKPETISRMECQLIRDFSTSADMLMDQFERFQRTGTLSHPVLNELLGVSGDRGSLWRLKDVAHILFFRPNNLSGQLLDRTIGTIFHETIKLMESTYLSQHYASACKTFITCTLACGVKSVPCNGLSPLHQETLCGVAGDLLPVLEGCTGDVRQGMERLGKLFEIARPLICICFSGKRNNQMLAKYLEDHEDMVKRVMGRFYEKFIESLNLTELPLPAEETKFASRFA